MDIRTLLIAALGCAALAASRAPVVDENAGELHDWRPRVALERVECLITDGIESTANLSPRLANRYHTAMASLWDARLFLTFRKLSERVDAKAKSGLRSDQARWLKLRARAANAAYEKEPPGIAASTKRALVESKWSREREEELRTLLAALEAKPAAKATAAPKPEPAAKPKSRAEKRAPSTAE